MQKLIWAGLSDVGRKRTGNEDAFLVDPDLGLYVVCDGMGGHASGEIASAMTTEEIHAFFSDYVSGRTELSYSGEKGATPEELAVSNAVQYANDKVYVAAMRDPRLEGMGTTVVGIVEYPDRFIMVHVGDSRIYRLRDGILEQVTRDHSLLNYKIDQGELRTQEEIKNFKQGNVIVRAIGLKDYVQPETAVHVRQPGDIYLLCSDGLTDMVDDWSIENALSANTDDLDEAVEILVRMANDRGGKDNITCILIRVDDELEDYHSDNSHYGFDEHHGANADEPTDPIRKAYVEEDGEAEGGYAHEDDSAYATFDDGLGDTVTETPSYDWVEEAKESSEDPPPFRQPTKRLGAVGRRARTEIVPPIKPDGHNNNGH